MSLERGGMMRVRGGLGWVAVRELAPVLSAADLARIRAGEVPARAHKIGYVRADVPPFSLFEETRRHL